MQCGCKCGHIWATWGRFMTFARQTDVGVTSPLLKTYITPARMAALVQDIVGYPLPVGVRLPPSAPVLPPSRFHSHPLFIRPVRRAWRRCSRFHGSVGQMSVFNRKADGRAACCGCRRCSRRQTPATSRFPEGVRSHWEGILPWASAPLIAAGCLPFAQTSISSCSRSL